MSAKVAKKLYEKAREIGNSFADTERMTVEETGLPRGIVPTRQLPGVYITPAGDFDVRDCSNPRNATSPWCGYNPVSTEPFDTGISASITKCGIVVQFSPTIGFIEFPPGHVAYVSEECREALDDIPFKPVKMPGTPEQLPQMTPPAEQTARFNPLCDYIIGLECNVQYQGVGFMLGGDTFFRKYEIMFNGSPYTFYNNTDDPIRSESSTMLIMRGWTIFDTENPSATQSRDNYTGQRQHWARRSIAAGNELVFIENYDQYMFGYGKTWKEWEPGTFWFDGDGSTFANRDPLLPVFRETGRMRQGDLPGGSRPLAYHQLEWSKVTGKMTPGITGYFHQVNLMKARGSHIISWLENGNFTGELGNGLPNGVQYSVGFVQELQCEHTLKYRLPSDDCHPRASEDCCDTQAANCYQEEEMGCCEDKNAGLNAKLDKILKNQGKFPVSISVWDDDPTKPKRQQANKSIGDISTSIDHLNKQMQRTMQILGIEEFTIEYPESVVIPQAQNNFEKLWAWLNPKKPRKIANLAQLIDWGNDQQSAVLGQWQQYVEYDGKPDGKGQPTKEKVVLPDVATTLRELFKMSAAQIQVSSLNTDIGAKTLATSTNAAVMLLETLERVKDMQTYMDYVTTEKKKKLPIQISPGEKATNLEKYLKPSKVEIVYDEWDAKNDESMQEALDSIKETLVVVLAQLGGGGT